jgi:hypothetical protein
MSERLLRMGLREQEVHLDHAQIRPPYEEDVRVAKRKLDEYEQKYRQRSIDIAKRSPKEVEAEISEWKINLIPVRGYGSDCFIATAVYEDENATEVIALRKFRDEDLLPSKIGRALVALYYCLSPPIARLLSANRLLRHVVRQAIVQPIVNLVRSNQ